MPSLDEARATILGFGRFHGLTLGEVAEREPTYIDWIAATITRDRDLVMRARVIASDLDAEGVERRPRVVRRRRRAPIARTPSAPLPPGAETGTGETMDG